MYLRDRLTDEKLQFIISDGSFGFIQTEHESDSDPVIKDIVTKKFYVLFVYNGNVGWEESSERPKQHLELIDTVSSKLIEVYLYDGSLAWREKYIPTSGTIKKLFQKKTYVPRRVEFNIDAVIAIKYSLEKKTKGIVSFLSSNLYNIIGWNKMLEMFARKLYGKQKLVKTYIPYLSGINKSKIRSLFSFPSRYKVTENKKIDVSCVSAYYETKTKLCLGKKHISTNKVIDFSGYRNDKIKKNIQFNIKGNKDLSSLLMAVGLIK